MSEPQTPLASEQKLSRLSGQLEHAQKMLAAARDAEVAAKAAYNARVRRALLSEECQGLRAAAERKAWAEMAAEDEEMALLVATAVRQAAADHLRTVRDQASVQQSIGRSVADAYRSNYGNRGT